MSRQHDGPRPPWSRYVALGDSFTEGCGDPDPSRPHGLRGWADRVAEVLAGHRPDLGYANLAIRGRKLPAILAEQVDPALALSPDLVSVHGGGNDVMRPRVDLDALAASYDTAIERLRGSGADVVVFTGADPGGGALAAAMRGRVAIFNEHVREVAERHGAVLVDLWRTRGEARADLMDVDRIHLNSRGHTLVAGLVLDALGVPHDLEPAAAEVRQPQTRVERFAADALWTRDFALPWVQRRLTGRSSGDGLSPRYGELVPARRLSRRRAAA